jgi:hypothetical protein
MKNLKKTVYTALCGLALVLLMAGCADILNGPARPEAKPGKATLTVGSGPARTITPDIKQFGKIVLSFTGLNGAADLAEVPVTNGSAEVEFPVGSWEVTAQAYLNDGDRYPAAASEAHVFSYNGTTEVTGDKRFILAATGAGPGTLEYSITVPAAVAEGSRIRIEIDGDPLTDLDRDGFTDGAHPISGSEAAIGVSLAAGRYVADILLVNEDGDTAMFRESVIILSGLVTELRYTPDKAAFLDPEERAAIPVVQFGTTGDNTGDIIIDELAPTDSPFSCTLDINAPAELNTVYFTLTKEAAHSVTISGTNADLVSSLANGAAAEGSTAGDTLGVFKADTSSVREEGGRLYFTLTVGEDGKTSLEITVTLTVETPETPMLWIDSAGEGESESLTAIAEQQSISTLMQALAWINSNAEDNTKYVIKLARDGQGDMTEAWTSPAGKTGVRITLRGVGVEREIGFSYTGVTTGAFNLNAGTTLALDENITVNGKDTQASRYVIQITGGVLEMYEGSRITRGRTPNSYHIVNITTDSAFRMYGGSIDHCVYSKSVVHLHNDTSVFDMYGGAITQNSLYSPNPSSATGTITSVRNLGAVHVYSNGAAFTMYGGEISENNFRGVFIENFGHNTSGEKIVFAMQGGRIINNGNTGVTYSGNTYYVNGTGVYIMGPSNNGSNGVFVMEGGEISGNGTAASAPYYLMGGGVFSRNKTVIKGGVISGNGNEHTPGAGIFAFGQLLFDGPANISDSVGFAAWNASEGTGGFRYVGDNFSTQSPISVDLCVYPNAEDFPTNWLGRQLILPNPDSSVVVNTALVEKFAIAGYFVTPTPTATTYTLQAITEVSDYDYAIDQNGTIIDAAQ